MPEILSPSVDNVAPDETTSAELEFLLRRFALPASRRADVELLLKAQAEGGTAVNLSTASPLDPAAWGQAAMLATQSDGDPRPLVLDNSCEGRGPWLQSWRFFSAERAIALALVKRAAVSEPVAGVPVAPILASEWGLNEAQARAVRMAASRRLAIITGGPGTGKTHTLARLLAVLVPNSGRAPDIRLAAPTGKAADRMREAIRQAADKLPVHLRERVADPLNRAAVTAGTLHSLLGHNPSTGRCERNARSPLSAEVVIVDECSMVDTLLWQALLAALRPETRLVLLGDPNQLESVAAGDVLGSLVRHISKMSSRTALAACWVELTESRRFRDQPDIGALAGAVTGGRPEEALSGLRRGAERLAAGTFDGGVAGLGDTTGLRWAALPEPVRAALCAVADATTPAEALRALEGVRVLSAHREGKSGAAGINAWIARELSARAARTGGRRWFSPVIINRNDAETGLKNGSVGVKTEGPGAAAKAWFPAEGEAKEPREIEITRLPVEHGPAWAMTIHRSQGSEFDHVCVVLPGEATSPLATRELFYTAITRARRAVYVCGGEAVIRRALADRSMRPTRLAARLEEAHKAG